MPRLISLVKDLTPDRPVIFRSHIQIQSDLVDQEGSPQADIWEFLWNNIKRADIFISHPVPSFVPKNIPRAEVAYMPATTDWLDGLNKDISEWDQSYYRNLYNQECSSSMMTKLTARKYIIQIARFDPAKGIDDVIKSYAGFRRLIEKHDPEIEAPQLVITGNSSVDDPESTRIYDETMNQLETKYPHLLSSVSVMRLNANDQLLNSLLSASHIVLQLSTREGFEVKVSEAIHKGKPVIATRTGGIPFQVQDRKNGFLVETGDWKAVAEHMFDLWTDDVLYQKMSQFAKKSVSDEVGTVGNALSWFYLADKWGNGKGVAPEGKWVNDLARKEAGRPYEKGENKLPRSI
jgi:alpha,alpha-trehalose phosphorylase (configuration-retaining)